MTETTSINVLACLILLLTLSYVFEVKTIRSSNLHSYGEKVGLFAYCILARVFVCLNCPFPSGLVLSLPSTSKTNTSVPSMFQVLLNIEGIWVQHRVSPEPFDQLL